MEIIELIDLFWNEVIFKNLLIFEIYHHFKLCNFVGVIK